MYVTRVRTAATVVVDQRVAADLAEPGVERSLAAIRIEPLDCLAEGLLHDFIRRIVIASQPDQREPVQPWEKAVEELPERALVPGQDPPGQFAVDVNRIARRSSVRRTRRCDPSRRIDAVGASIFTRRRTFTRQTRRTTMWQAYIARCVLGVTLCAASIAATAADGVHGGLPRRALRVPSFRGKQLLLAASRPAGVLQQPALPRQGRLRRARGGVDHRDRPDPRHPACAATAGPGTSWRGSYRSSRRSTASWRRFHTTFSRPASPTGTSITSASGSTSTRTAASSAMRDSGWPAEWRRTRNHHAGPGVPAGVAYMQEIAPGVAMDRAEHVAMDLDVNVPAGSFDDCVGCGKRRRWSRAALDQGLLPGRRARAGRRTGVDCDL